MKIKFIALVSAVFLIVLVAEPFAQGMANTNEWHGLRLGTSTTSDALELLGKPAIDKINQRYRPLRFEERFDVETNDFRVFHYEGRQKIRGFDDVKLFFREDVLMAIRLEPKKLKAFALERAYGSEFQYLEDEISEVLIPRDIGRDRGRPRSRSYPMFYYLMNETSEAYAFAAIDNNSVEEIFGGSGKNSKGSRPGNVSKLDLISTKLESNDGADLLK